jgi:hypothetical protein
VLHIGQINNRDVFYTNVRVDEDWFKKLPASNWLALTIADYGDEGLLNDTTIKILDNGTCYTWSVGELGSLTEDYFDEEIVWRQVQEEEKTGKPQNYETTPMTIYDDNFANGVWYALISAYAIEYDIYLPMDKVVCIDLTKKGYKDKFIELFNKIKNGWIPSEGE